MGITKEHLLQGLKIFLSGFLTIVGSTLAQGDVAWTSAFWYSLVIAGVGAGIKELFAKFAPLSFGGRIGKTALGARRS